MLFGYIGGSGVMVRCGVCCAHIEHAYPYLAKDARSKRVDYVYSIKKNGPYKISSSDVLPLYRCDRSHARILTKATKDKGAGARPRDTSYKYLGVSDGQVCVLYCYDHVAGVFIWADSVHSINTHDRALTNAVDLYHPTITRQSARKKYRYSRPVPEELQRIHLDGDNEGG